MCSILGNRDMANGIGKAAQALYTHALQGQHCTFVIGSTAVNNVFLYQVKAERSVYNYLLFHKYITTVWMFSFYMLCILLYVLMYSCESSTTSI